MGSDFNDWRVPSKAALVLFCAAVAACSQNTERPPRSIAGDVPTVNRGKFTESEYGVRSSDRVAGLYGPVPKGGGTFKLGSPYSVAGRWYVPREEPGYDRNGRASWYGDDFHGRKTANGEVFDMRALTAAHPTLPLPSYAYVTNLANGRTILVRINDRGPYANDRIIDLSHASARALGYEEQGIAQVRVRYGGRAPLNGDDRRERQFLAEQRWNRGGGLPVVAELRPRNAPLDVPQQFPAGTAGRWSPAAYRAQLAGKDAPPAPVKYSRQAALAPAANIRTASLDPVPLASAAAPPRQGTSELTWIASPRPGPRDDYVRPSLAGAPPPPAIGSGRAYVQVGIFRDRLNAEKLRRDLATLGPIELTPMPSGTGGEFYRVRVGPLIPNDANRALSEVSQRGISGGRVVVE